MRRVLVRYKVKADRAQENITFIQKVFDELIDSQLEGVRYAAFKQSDGVSFVHLASIETDGNPLAQTQAFKAFQAQLRDRCEVPPAVEELEMIGSYRMLGS